MIYLAAFIMMLYISFSVKCGGTPSSLSETYYTLKHNWLFPLLMVTLVILCAPALLVVTSGLWKILIVITGFSIIGVGLTPYKHCNKHYKAHYILTCIAMVSMCTLYLIKGMWFIPLVLLFVGFRKNWLLGVETALFGSCWIYPFI